MHPNKKWPSLYMFIGKLSKLNIILYLTNVFTIKKQDGFAKYFYIGYVDMWEGGHVYMHLHSQGCLHYKTKYHYVIFIHLCTPTFQHSNIPCPYDKNKIIEQDNMWFTILIL
jgi:hypothetical protein